MRIIIFFGSWFYLIIIFYRSLRQINSLESFFISLISEDSKSNSDSRLYDSKMIARRYFPKLSIIIPCFEKGRFLPRAFKSCIEDQYLTKYKFNIEIICIDDASTDDTFKIFNDLKNKYETEDVFNNSDKDNIFKNNVNIKVFRFNKNKGTLYSRIFALNQTNADYIMSLDADDEIIPGHMQRLLTLIQSRNDVDIIQYRCLCLNEIDEKKKIESKINGSVNFGYWLFSYGTYPFNVTHNLNLEDSIEVLKYKVGEKNLNQNNNLDQLSHSHLINASTLRKMILRSSIMWNLPGIIMKRKLMLKSVLALDFDPSYKKVCEYEDRLILYACFYFCEKLYFLDEVGYIYHSGIYTPKRKPRARYVNFLLNRLLVSGKKNV